MSVATNGSISVLLLEVQSLYASKQYDEAVKCLTKALKPCSYMPNSPKIDVLDQRASAYVKLNKLDLALSDAKGIIRIDRTDGRGYLRCGQLEQFKGNHAAAVTWYEHGVRRVSVDNKLHDLLEKQLIKARELVSSQVRLSKPTDPMTMFPIEVVRMILVFLDYRQHVGILRVSKSWKRVISQMPPVLDTVDFRKANRSITHPMLNASFNRLSKNPQVLIFTDLTDAAVKLARSQLERWINYRTLTRLEILSGKLRIRGLRFDKFDLSYLRFGPSTTVQLSELYDILKACGSLQTAIFESLVVPTSPYFVEWSTPIRHEKLRRLEMMVKPTARLKILPLVLEHFPNLQHLLCDTIHIGNIDELQDDWDMSKLLHLQELHIMNSNIKCLKTLSESLEVLILHRTILRVSLERTPQMSNLRKFEVYDCQLAQDTFDRLTNSGSACSPEELSISFAYFADGRGDFRFPRLRSHNWLNNLQVLRAKGALADGDADLFIQEMSNLRKLTVEHSRILTGVFFAEVLRAPTCKIEHIVLVDCSSISADTIDWARTRGVRVEVRNTDTGRAHAGRRVRDI